MALALERRRSPRMTPAAQAAGVLIMDADEKWMMPAKLVNVSSDGGLICPGILAATTRRLCLLFENVPEAGWIDSEVVRSPGPGEVGIRFLSPLSTEFVRTATSEGKAGRNGAVETPFLGAVIPIR
jgi:hypothetical protein